jgi:hypothetical protein
MKKLTALVFIIILGVCAWLVIKPIASPNRARPVGALQVAPPGQSADSQKQDAASNDAEKKVAQESQTAKIPIGPDEVLLQVQTLNLDNDADDEQIILVKKKDDPEEKIHIIVADFDPARNEYYRAWEDTTEATKFMTFSVFLKDLIGDHNLNLVCMGMNNNNEQTLTVFWKIRAPNNGKGLYYGTVCRLAADGSVRIDEQERSEAYQLGQINGVSFPITAFSRDKKSPNMLDQIETVYAFNYKSGKYEKTQEIPVTGQQIESGRLKDILNGDEKRFESYIKGIWYKTTVTDTKDPSAQLIMFDRAQNNVVFNADNLQEVYTWESSHSTQYGIYVATENELVSTMRRFVDIELKAPDTIDIKTYDDVQIKVEVSGKWDGTYKRLGSPATPGAAQAAQPGQKPAVKQDALSGVFSGDDDTELEFSGQNRVIFRKNKKTQEGGYAFFQLGQQSIFEIKLLKTTDSPGVVRTYIAKLDKRDSGSAISLMLTLIPARIGMEGAEPLQDRTITYEQRTKK